MNITKSPTRPDREKILELASSQQPNVAVGSTVDVKDIVRGMLRKPVAPLKHGARYVLTKDHRVVMADTGVDQVLFSERGNRHVADQWFCGTCGAEYDPQMIDSMEWMTAFFQPERNMIEWLCPPPAVCPKCGQPVTAIRVSTVFTGIDMRVRQWNDFSTWFQFPKTAW
jgi:hypothetical protein